MGAMASLLRISVTLLGLTVVACSESDEASPLVLGALYQGFEDTSGAKLLHVTTT